MWRTMFCSSASWMTALKWREEKAEELRKQLRAHDNSSPSIGLRNLSRRLYLRYGDGSGLQIREQGRAQVLK